MERHAARLPDRPYARLAVVSPVVGPLDYVALEDQRGKIEAKSALALVPLVLVRIPVEAHWRILR